jgi:hypothetical protein
MKPAFAPVGFPAIENAQLVPFGITENDNVHICIL